MDYWEHDVEKVPNIEEWKLAELKRRAGITEDEETHNQMKRVVAQRLASVQRKLARGEIERAQRMVDELLTWFQ